MGTLEEDPNEKLECGNLGKEDICNGLCGCNIVGFIISQLDKYCLHIGHVSFILLVNISCFSFKYDIILYSKLIFLFLYLIVLYRQEL